MIALMAFSILLELSEENIELISMMSRNLLEASSLEKVKQASNLIRRNFHGIKILDCFRSNKKFEDVGSKILIRVIDNDLIGTFIFFLLVL